MAYIMNYEGHYLNPLGVCPDFYQSKRYNDFEYELQAKKAKLGLEPPRIMVTRDLWFQSFMPKHFN